MNLTRKDIPFLLCLFILCLIFFLFYTWEIPLIDPDEPRYASTAKEMVLDNNWIVPVFNDSPRINKPPLFYWMVAVSYKVFGINEFGARFPSAMAAICSVLITYLFGKMYGSRKSGFWTGMVLISSPLFFIVSRLCITDMLLTFFITTSLYLFFDEYIAQNKSNLKRSFFFFSFGMVFLVKGPVGILLVIMIILFFLIWIRDIKYIRWFCYLPGFIIFPGIICIWGVPFLLSLNIDQLFVFYMQETIGRFFGGYAHPEPFYYYLPVCFIGYFPWSMLVCACLICIYKKRNELSVEEKKRIYFLFSWVFVSMVFFSLSRSKLMTYLLPISPAVALLTISHYQRECDNGLWKRFKWTSWLILSLYIVFPLFLLFAIPKVIPIKYGIPMYYADIPVVILLVGALTAFFVFVYGKGFSQKLKVLCFSNDLFLLVTVVLMARYLGTFRSTKDIVAQSCLNKINDCALLSYAKTLPSLVFYGEKHVSEITSDASFGMFHLDKKSPVYLVMTLDSFLKNKDWILKMNFYAVSQNNAHIVLKKEEN